MNDTSTMRRCDLLPFLLDVLDFMAEQIELAKSDVDRVAALDAASGAVPMFRQRLQEDEHLAAPAILVLAEWMFVGHWHEIWDDLAKEPADRFAKSADDLIERINTGKTAIQNAANRADDRSEPAD